MFLRNLFIVVGSISLMGLLFILGSIFIVPTLLISDELMSVPLSLDEGNLPRIIEETAEESDADHRSFWLNSGALAEIEEDTIRTIHGSLPTPSYWRMIYRIANPIDSDNGYHPQNLFRLVTRSTFNDSDQTVFAQISDIHQSESPARNESNGILLMSRYVNDETLYYGGIRVDGYAVIKRKREGVYETLAYTPIFLKGSAYDRDTFPNLIPEKTWVGLRLITRDRADGSTELILYINESGTWKKALQVRDRDPILHRRDSTRAGLRSDFMDVEFRGYRVGELLEF